MSSPFSVLELQPTLDAAAVKRAYYKQLGLHPPHSDPEGFRILRAAYEALSAPGALAAAYLNAPFNLAPALAAYEETLGAALATARAEAAQTATRSAAGTAAVETLSAMTLQQARDTLDGAGVTPPSQ